MRHLSAGAGSDNTTTSENSSLEPQPSITPQSRHADHPTDPDGPPSIHGTPFFGVQLRLLDDVVEAYDRYDPATFMSWCEFVAPAAGSEQSVVGTAPLAAMLRHIGTPYASNWLGLLATAVCCCRPMRSCAAWACPSSCGESALHPKMFCSELIGNVFKELGHLPEDVDSEKIVPADFFERGALGVTYDLDSEIPVLFKPPVRFCTV